MKKIMFNDCYGLTQAVIEGRKTMTRRIVPWDLTEQWMEFVSDSPSVGGVYVHESEKDFYEREAPRYKDGEIVAVAQNYSSFYNILDNTRQIPEGAGWNNKRSFLGIWITLSTFDNKEEMENVAKKIERLGNVVIRMN